MSGPGEVWGGYVYPGSGGMKRYFGKRLSHKAQLSGAHWGLMERTLEPPSVMRTELRPWERWTGTILDTGDRISCVCPWMYVCVSAYACLCIHVCLCVVGLCISMHTHRGQGKEQLKPSSFALHWPGSLLSVRLVNLRVSRDSRLCLPSDAGALGLWTLILHPEVCGIRGSKLTPAYTAALYWPSLLQSKLMLSISYLVSEILFQQHTQAKTK